MESYAYVGEKDAKSNAPPPPPPKKIIRFLTDKKYIRKEHEKEKFLFALAQSMWDISTALADIPPKKNQIKKKKKKNHTGPESSSAGPEIKKSASVCSGLDMKQGYGGLGQQHKTIFKYTFVD